MIVPAALQSIPFPWILLDEREAVIATGEGALFPAPPNTLDPALAAASSTQIGGWATCSDGYAIYRFTTPVLHPGSIVLYGLKITDLSTAIGRSTGLSIKLTQEQLQTYVRGFSSGLEALDDSYRSLIRQSIHEVRGINSPLYHAALELQESLRIEGSRNAGIAKSVVLLSELLGGRVDFMDFIANPSAQAIKASEIAVYRKFDKVQRCFRVMANRRGIEFEMSGSSTKTVSGPPVFDLVPYLLIDNAVKYSPDRYPIRIICNDTAGGIICSVKSLGPRIEEGEVQGLFTAGVRGANAKKTQKEGSGLGLAVLKKIVDDVFHGSVNISQSENKLSINSVPYCEVTFEIRLPAARSW